MSSIQGILGQVMGGAQGGQGGGFDLTSMLAQVGNALTNNMRPTGPVAATSDGPPVARPTTFVPNAQGVSCGVEARSAGPPTKIPRFNH